MNEISDLPIPTPSMAGNLWPVVPSQRAATILALLFQLEQSQWWAPERLQAAQFRQAAELLRHARRTVPYYGKRFDHIAWRHGQPLTPEIWSELPLLKREDIQGAGDRLHSRALPKSHGKIATISTSGSTGKPVKVLTTELTATMWRVFSQRDIIWRRCDLSGKLAAIRFDRMKRAAYPEGLAAKSWGIGSGATLPTGPAVVLSITTPVEDQLEWLQRQQPEYQITHPTNLEAMLMYAAQERVRLTSLKEIQTISEVLNPSVRTLCREVLGVGVNDMYTTQEAGYLALQCPGQEHYHVQAENVFFEILDDRGKQCAPGQVGKVVVTSLHNFAMPLIRYDIGDFAEVGEGCSCGRGLPVIKHIAGRVRGMVVLPDGRRHWPFFGSGKFSSVAPITQFQLVQKTLDTIEVKLVAGRTLSEGEERSRSRQKSGPSCRC